MTPLQKLPNNVGYLGKIIVATGFEWLPKAQNIAQSGHTAHGECCQGQSNEPLIGYSAASFETFDGFFGFY